MVEATISRVRMRDLARRGRFRSAQPLRGFAESVAPPSGRPRPGDGDLMASAI
jgi:hypothetical protein